jgi:hypothetical protein
MTSNIELNKKIKASGKRLDIEVLENNMINKVFRT